MKKQLTNGTIYYNAYIKTEDKEGWIYRKINREPPYDFNLEIEDKREYGTQFICIEHIYDFIKGLNLKSYRLDIFEIEEIIYDDYTKKITSNIVASK